MSTPHTAVAADEPCLFTKYRSLDKIIEKRKERISRVLRSLDSFSLKCPIFPGAREVQAIAIVHRVGEEDGGYLAGRIDNFRWTEAGEIQDPAKDKESSTKLVCPAISSHWQKRRKSDKNGSHLLEEEEEGEESLKCNIIGGWG